VVKAMLSASFERILSSDFYISFNVYAGLYQRCSVHLLHDCHGLKEQHPDNADVQQWAKHVKAVYYRPVAYAWSDLRLPSAKQQAALRKFQLALLQWKSI
jgi:hypothetical protein